MIKRNRVSRPPLLFVLVVGHKRTDTETDDQPKGGGGDKVALKVTESVK